MEAEPNFRKSSYSGQEPNCVEVAPLSTNFRKSRLSGVNGDCAEMAPLHSGAALRDSKHAELGHLAFPAPEWGAFLSAVRSTGL